MNLKFVFTASFIISLVCTLGFALIAILIGQQNIAGFDNRLISLIQGWESDKLTPIMKFFSFIGSTLPVVSIAIAIIVVLYLVLKFRWELLFFVCVIAGSALLNVVLKLIFQRPRPTLHRIVEEHGYSFPSGHSMAAFTLYCVLCFLLWKHTRGALARTLLIVISSLIIVAIGVSRIYLGVHYPSDIIGGYLASGTWLAISIGLFQRFMERRYANARSR